MRALVTGAAGFIGSTLVDDLLEDGHDVIGVDAFTDYYDAAAKWANLTGALRSNRFRLVEADLRSYDPAELFDGVDVVFHQAGQPGVRLSWADGFQTYVDCNVSVTQRVLEASRRSGVARFVYASSSSIYGNAPAYPVTEETLPQPFSPYGVTKLAGEHLCSLYAANFGLSTVSLRYFTVYGPRQRPDMATHRLVEAALHGTEFPLFGDGSHVRDFTFVGDIVAANRAAGAASVEPGLVVNVCGGSSTSMHQLIDVVGKAVGAPVRLDVQSEQRGDVLRTGGDHGKALTALGWEPKVSLVEGVTAQVEWHRRRRSMA